MCVGHPAEKLDQIDVVKGLRRPTDGIDRAARAGSQIGPVAAMRECITHQDTEVCLDTPAPSYQLGERCRHTPP